MKTANVIRVVAAALVLSTLSFAAGVAGDLSLADPPNYGERVVLRLPPELPGDAVRAAPLPILSTGAAEASPIEVSAYAVALIDAPEALELAPLPKYGSDLLRKPEWA